MRRIAVLTSGGDSSGMNACVRAVVRKALSENLEVVGIQKGYQGLIDRQYQIMSSRSVSGILQRGGTVLHSARCKAMMDEAGQKLAAENLQGLGVEGLIVIGGEGSLKGAQSLHRKGIPAIGIPASIDNDIPFTDMSLGVDTALNNIIYAVDCLKDTASSHSRAFVVECMGRNCGYLTTAAAVACGAEFAIIPEAPFSVDEICECLKSRYREGRDNALILVAEGAARAQNIADQIKDKIGFETRLMVLGHYQRGGSPSVFDRLLGARFGVKAVEGLLQGQSGSMVGLACGGVCCTPLEQVFQSGSRPIDEVILKLAKTLVI
ncbi:MAG: 6-phosphofructokinase [Desulfuromonadaceae bacterium]|jgi:6-phosphofructokinase 1|nr:6-phosphofructokinase [Desulfuromonadaceae bacterium]